MTSAWIAVPHPNPIVRGSTRRGQRGAARTRSEPGNRTRASPPTDAVGRRARPRRCPSRSGPPGWAWLVLLLAVVVTGCFWLRVDPGPLDRFDAWITDVVTSFRAGWLDALARQAHTIGSRVGFALARVGPRALDRLVPSLAPPRDLGDRARHRGSSPPGARAGLPAAAAVRRAAARELGGLRDAVDPDRRDRDPVDRRRVHARRARPAPVLGEAGGGGRDHDHRACSGSTSASTTSPTSCSARSSVSSIPWPPSAPSPRTTSSRSLTARAARRAPRRHRAPGRGDPHRAAGPARVHGARRPAGRARGLRRLDPAEAHRDRRGGPRADDLRASSTRRATCARTAGTSSAARCSTDGSRTRRRSRPSAGSSSTRTTRCACSASTGSRRPRRSASSRSRRSAST